MHVHVLQPAVDHIVWKSAFPFTSTSTDVVCFEHFLPETGAILYLSLYVAWLNCCREGLFLSPPTGHQQFFLLIEGRPFHFLQTHVLQVITLNNFTPLHVCQQACFAKFWFLLIWMKRNHFHAELFTNFMKFLNFTHFDYCLVYLDSPFFFRF